MKTSRGDDDVYEGSPHSTAELRCGFKNDPSLFEPRPHHVVVSMVPVPSTASNKERPERRGSGDELMVGDSGFTICTGASPNIGKLIEDMARVAQLSLAGIAVA